EVIRELAAHLRLGAAAEVAMDATPRIRRQEDAGPVGAARERRALAARQREGQGHEGGAGQRGIEALPGHLAQPSVGGVGDADEPVAATARPGLLAREHDVVGQQQRQISVGLHPEVLCAYPSSEVKEPVADPVVVGAGEGGLPCARVRSARADAEIYLHGGHVTRWQPRGAEPVLFLSRRAVYAPGKAIRGGVPLIFPWFGPRATDPRAPMHGFARSRAWRLLTSGPGPDDSVVLELGLEDDDATRALWSSAFSLRYRVIVGATLSLTIEVVNTSPAPFTFETALHTYLAVGDVEAVTITGLEDTRFLDKVDGVTRKRHGPAPLRLTGETDRA